MIYKTNEEGSTETITSSAAYDENDFLMSTTDEFGVVATYTTDEAWGVVTATSTGGVTVTNFMDDDKCAVQQTMFGLGIGVRLTSYTYGSDSGNLTGLSQHGVSYGYGYTKGDLTSVSKNGTEIETHTYADTPDGESVKSTVTSTYGAYSKVQEFDKYGRLIRIQGALENAYGINPRGELGEYRFDKGDSNDVLATVKDLITDQITRYYYENGKVAKSQVVIESGEDVEVLSGEEYKYDTLQRLTNDDYYIDSDTTSQFEYQYSSSENDLNADNRVSAVKHKINGTEQAYTELSYDAYKRVSQKKHTVGGKSFTKEYIFNKTRVDNVKGKNGTALIHNTNYSYDAFGRITAETDSTDTSRNVQYQYDSFGQLTREQYNSLDKKVEYVYNESGNITSITSSRLDGTGATTKTLAYDTTYPDRLTSFDGRAIGYNTYGYLTSYRGWTYSWSKGRLSTISNGTLQTGRYRYSFSYNGLGQRTKKMYTYIQGTGDIQPVGAQLVYSKTDYTYDNAGRLIKENRVDRFSEYTGVAVEEVREFRYLYDANSIIGMVYTSNGTTNTYYFDKNLQGDVIGIYDTSGNLKAKYSYDAFGNCTITNSTIYDLAKNNPIRYRGYYYETETDLKLYYLNARYYNPELRRFISPDDTSYIDPETPNGLNLYAYCNNDPVNYADPSGHLAISTILLTALIVGAVSAGANVVGQVIFDGQTLETLNWMDVGISFVAGFAAGLIPGSGFVSMAGQALVSSMVSNGLYALTYKDKNFNWSQVFADAFIQIGAGYLMKGLSSLTSKMTSKIFIKGNNYSQFQHYYRTKGYNYSRAQAAARMGIAINHKWYADQVIDYIFGFVWDVATYES